MTKRKKCFIMELLLLVFLYEIREKLKIFKLTFTLWNILLFLLYNLHRLQRFQTLNSCQCVNFSCVLLKNVSNVTDNYRIKLKNLIFWFFNWIQIIGLSIYFVEITLFHRNDIDCEEALTWDLFWCKCFKWTHSH